MDGMKHSPGWRIHDGVRLCWQVFKDEVLTIAVSLRENRALARKLVTGVGDFSVGIKGCTRRSPKDQDLAGLSPSREGGLADELDTDSETQI